MLSPDAKHIPELDGLRGIACLLVIAGHLRWYWPWLPDYASPGVYIFFALSGFLITRNLLADRENPRRVRDFYARRCARLMPLFYAAVLLVWLCTRSANWWAYVTYTANFNGHYMPGLYHFWSLFVEEHYYLLWPAVVWLASPRKVERWTWAVVALSLPLTCVAAAAYELAPPAVFYNMIALACRGTPTNLVALLIGSAVAFRETWWRDRLRLLWLGAALIAAGWIASRLVGGLAAGDDAPMNSALTVWWWHLVCAGVFCVVLARPLRAVNALFGAPPLRWVGRISYGLYVIHWPVFSALRYFDGMFGARASVAAPVLTVLISFALAHASFTWFESPIQRAVRGWLRSPPVPALHRVAA